VRRTGRARIETESPDGIGEALASIGYEIFPCDRGIEAAVSEQDFPGLVARVAASGFPFTLVELRHESLEDLFMRLATGRHE
jgi:hypothetical protein